MNPKKLLFLSVLSILVIANLAACDLSDETGPGQTKTDQTKTEDQTPPENQKGEEKPAEDTIDTPTKDDQVDFIKPVKLDTKKVLGNYLTEMHKTLGITPDANGKIENDFVLNMVKFYEVGTIKIDPYKGEKLLVMDVTFDGPSMSATLSRLAWNEQSGKLTVLENYSDTDYVEDYLKPLFADADKNFHIKILDLPNTVMLPDGSNSIKLKTKNVDVQTSDKVTAENPDGIDYADLGKVAFTDSKLGKFYLSTGTVGCLYTVAADSTVASYAFDPGITGEKTDIMAQWDDGSDATWMGNGYELSTGGCGIGSNCYFIENTKEDQLKKIGKTSNGIELYMAKDQQRITDKNALDKLVDQNQPLWNLNYNYNLYVDMQQYLTEEQKADKVKTYEEFLADRPIMYWKDPFGRFSAIVKTEYKPPAECGKPVIYLYPEKTSEVSVKVGIDEFTATVPDYGQGWKVVAQPNGELTNLADGKKYEYLFWEGKSDRKLGLSGGSVVAKADLEKFLGDSLPKLGLNEKEAADFREFWLPKMTATAEPYVLVSFVGTHDFNKIAPLDINPKPDTVIRVFMYYQPLASKISLPAQQLTSPARNGFTVIEWGGTSSDGWQIK